MKLSSIALKNLKQNFSFYSLYLFSVAFVLMIFFCFISFSMNEIIIEKISSDGRVETMCRTVAVFVMSFVIFYMSYSNKFFMRRRMKELGIYALLGYRKSAMLKLLSFENLIICTGGLTVGILCGSLLHKGITSGIIHLLTLPIDSSTIPFINPEAVIFSGAFVLLVLLGLTLSNARLLHNTTLLNLVRLEKKGEKPIQVHCLTAVLGIVLTLAGYAFALDVLRGRESVWYTIGFSPVALFTLLCVTAGTVLFIYSFLPYASSKIRADKKLLFRETTIITVPKFMHRIRSNAKSLILLILLSAGTLAVLGATLLSVWYPFKALERIIPSAIEYRVTDDTQKISSLEALDQALGSGSYDSHETTVLKVTARSGQLPEEYNISRDKGRTPGFECISQSDYLALSRMQGHKTPSLPLSKKECILMKYRPDKDKKDIGASYTLMSGDTVLEDVIVKNTSLKNPIGFGNSVGMLVISDSAYEELLAAAPECFQVISINGQGMRSSRPAYETLKKLMPDNPYLVCAWQRQDELFQANSSTLLLICFASIIFLAATGSILYFQNISSAAYDMPDYEIMGKMGYSHALIKQTVRRQIKIYFLIPYVMGLVHSIFALICYKTVLMDDLLDNASAVLTPILFSIVVFTVIYLIYYLLTKRACYKIAITLHL